MHKTYTKYLKKIKELNKEIQDVHGIKDSLLQDLNSPQIYIRCNLKQMQSQTKFQE